MFLGAIFRTLKGGYDAVTIRKKVKEYNEELAKDLLESFSSYDQFFARERMLLAEYMIELSKLKAKKAKLEELFALRERMNRRMEEILEKAEQELEARNATKLDLARVVNSLRELSLAIDRDLSKLQTEQKELEGRISQVSERLEAQNQETEAFQKRAQTLFNSYEGISKDLHKQELNLTKHAGLIWGFNIIVVIAILGLIWWH